VLPWLVGTAYMAPIGALGSPAPAAYSTQQGVPSQTSAQIVARMQPVLAAGGVGGVTLLAGTNDAANSVTVSTFLANIQYAAALCRSYGVPLVVGLTPPRAAADSSATHQLVQGYNHALRAWAPGAGVYLADTYGALVDPTSGAMLASLLSSSPPHPNTAGHQALAVAFASACKRAMASQPTVTDAQNAASRVTNNMFQSGSSTGWYLQPSGTGQAPTMSVVADSALTHPTGRLPSVAEWLQMDFDGTGGGGGGTRTYATALSGTFTLGDVLLVSALMDLTDVTGFFAALNADPNTASIQFGVTDHAGTYLAAQRYQTPMSIVPGDLAVVAVAPSDAASGMLLWLTVTLPTGVHGQVRISCADVLNLTALGVPTVW
jgi:hypothetical protein